MLLKFSRIVGLFCAALLAFAPCPAARADAPRSERELHASFSPLVKRTSPAVVNIYATRVVRTQANPLFADPLFAQFFGVRGMPQSRIENSLGSGVVVDASGLIATNTHVIQGATEINVVTADGREFKAEKVLSDPRTDLAVLRVQPKGEKLPYLDFADSDQAEVGDIVLAIGNPFGVGQTVTMGIISGLSRSNVQGPGDYSFFIQTDAAINPGNSGGALIDVDGKLVGINSMIYSKDGGSLGIGFAIPANMVKTVVDASRHGGQVVRPWSGLTSQSVTTDMVEGLGLSRAAGALVSRVHPHSPAFDAGIRPGDVITTVNGRDVQGSDALKFRLATAALGSEVKLGVFRGGKNQEFTFKAVAPPEDPPRDTALLAGRNPVSGATVANISPAVSEELGGTQRDTGVVIEKADRGYAQRLGLQPGDILLAVDGAKIENVKGLKEALGTGSHNWRIEIMRGGQVMDMRIGL
jgi:serine protease Do